MLNKLTFRWRFLDARNFEDCLRRLKISSSRRRKRWWPAAAFAEVYRSASVLTRKVGCYDIYDSSNIPDPRNRWDRLESMYVIVQLEKMIGARYIRRIVVSLDSKFLCNFIFLLRYNLRHLRKYTYVHKHLFHSLKL